MTRRITRRIQGYTGYPTYEWEAEDRGFSAVYAIKASVSDYYPAQLYGPAEDCYEAEGGEMEIEEITLQTVQFFSDDGNRTIVFTSDPAVSREAILHWWPKAKFYSLSDLPEHRKKELEDEFDKLVQSDAVVEDQVRTLLTGFHPEEDDRPEPDYDV